MFPTGVIVDAIAVILGGMTGALCGRRISGSYKERLSSIFGVCAMSMGISAIILMENLPAVIFAAIAGTAIGIAIHFGSLIETGAVCMQKPIAKLLGNTQSSSQDSEAETAMLVTVIVLFCASGTGIYGAIDAGITGNHSILISKAILDFFSSLIFACQLGLVVPMIAIPQFFIFYPLFLCAKLIFPLVTPAMINDFKACGGILLLATGFRMMNLRPLPTADMIVSMIIVMPCSWIWINQIMPLL